MGQATHDAAQTVITLKGNATIPAYTIVTLVGQNKVGICATTTARIFGVTTQLCAGDGAAAPVCIAGVTRVVAGASVSAGAILCVQGATTTGYAIEATADSFTNTTTTLISKTLGQALQAGSTLSVVNVLLQINNISKIG
jgi:hypothetical protein